MSPNRPGSKSSGVAEAVSDGGGVEMETDELLASLGGHGRSGFAGRTEPHRELSPNAPNATRSARTRVAGAPVEGPSSVVAGPPSAAAGVAPGVGRHSLARRALAYAAAVMVSFLAGLPVVLKYDGAFAPTSNATEQGGPATSAPPPAPSVAAPTVPAVVSAASAPPAAQAPSPSPSAAPAAPQKTVALPKAGSPPAATPRASALPSPAAPPVTAAAAAPTQAPHQAPAAPTTPAPAPTLQHGGLLQ